MIKNIILGGYRQTKKILNRYKINEKDVILPNENIVYLLNPKYCHKNIK